MSSFEELLEIFNKNKCTENEALLFNAVTALITIVETQKQQIEDLEFEISLTRKYTYEHL